MPCGRESHHISPEPVEQVHEHEQEDLLFLLQGPNLYARSAISSIHERKSTMVTLMCCRKNATDKTHSESVCSDCVLFLLRSL